MSKITFTPIIPIEKSFYPEPSSKNIPDWYKKTESFLGSKKICVHEGSSNITIKKCLPVFDAMTMGYIIKTYVDVYVSKTEDGLSYYNWPSYEPLSFHIIDQAKNHPSGNDMPYPKWSNPWSIKTEKGYSCLFIPPMHNPNGIFTIMPGVVDTDQYINRVNFPFTLDDKNFEGMIPAGTPICQVIPFKRESYSMKIGKEKNRKDHNLFEAIYSNRWVNNYRNKFWNRKEYR